MPTTSCKKYGKMPAESKILVLRRFVVGDQDLLVKVYGYGGMMNLLVKDGALTSNLYITIFEPFNVMDLIYRQSGPLILPMDIKNLIPLSYYATEYSRYEWMCLVSITLIRFVKYYDKELFDLFVNYLKLKTSNVKTLHLRLYVDILVKMGIYKQSIFKKRHLRIVKSIMSLDIKSLERLNIDQKDYLDIKVRIEDYLRESL